MCCVIRDIVNVLECLSFNDGKHIMRYRCAYEMRAPVFLVDALKKEASAL